jgi:hypothetical protein
MAAGCMASIQTVRRNELHRLYASLPSGKEHTHRIVVK